MKKLIATCFFLNFLYGSAQPPEKVHAAVFDYMKGTWKGSGWMMTEKGKTSSNISEKVQCKLDCSIYITEGLGIKFDSATKKDIVVHDAFGIIAYDKTKQKWVLRAFKKEVISESELEFLADKKFRWGMQVPGGEVRFTTDFSTGKWVENGEFSRDKGATWMEIMSMSLDKQN